MLVYRTKYKMGDVDFFNIRNRNEGRVVRALADLVEKRGRLTLTDKDLHDIYALALNKLPPRYTQRGTIVLRDSVSKSEVRAAVEDAYDMVVAYPKP